MARTFFFIISFVFLIGAFLIGYFISPTFYYAFLILLPVFFLGVYDVLQKKHAILRNFPVIGHFRYLLESFRPEIMQYFVETNTEGRPFNRIYRSLIYQRAKNQTDTTPFGTQVDVYRPGHEWIDHSIYPKDAHKLDHNPKVMVGSSQCKQPYVCSIFNISAMSYGSLSNRAVEALNKGALLADFAHNTGEGGISPYHLKHNGDLIYQIGTGYFGCRSKEGRFSPEKFKKTVSAKQVKMIELKLSQGAKPGHGGILPAKKNTKEIAQIRGVEPHKAVHSPPFHKAFDSPEGLMQFIKQLRDLSEGRPVGFKLCIGKKQEFIDICLAIKKTGIFPDFIAIDGAEGGTGAAPVEFSDRIGMPYKDALAFVYNTLVAHDLKKEIKLFAAGKIVSGFQLARAFALGADVCYSARGMMMALGCIQALQCNSNTCPVGIATQNKQLIKGLNIEDKGHRVANYHKKTVSAFLELLAAAGLERSEQLERKHINRRINSTEFKTYEEIFPY